ncbi:MAG: hypothetical protein P4L43_05415 [Syntrophobacteraceae bacterium]|nr:hypothetical protein [Syntrophobacteraceae bacterium]
MRPLLLLSVPVLFFFTATVILPLLVLRLPLLLLLVLYAGLPVLRLWPPRTGGLLLPLLLVVLLLWPLHSWLLLPLLLLLVLYAGLPVLRLWPPRTGVLRGRLRRSGFASFGAGWNGGVAFYSFLPRTSVALIVLLEEFLTITPTLPVSAPIRILSLKTLPVFGLSPIP